MKMYDFSYTLGTIMYRQLWSQMYWSYNIDMYLFVFSIGQMLLKFAAWYVPNLDMIPIHYNNNYTTALMVTCSNR